MDEAKVVINLKEGIIELQGPVDFVRHYLDTYQSAIKGLPGLPEDVAAAPEKTKAGARRRRAIPGTKAAKGKRASGVGSIRADLEAGFFDEPRSTGEVRQRLSDAGLTFTDNGVRAALRRLSLSGSLDVVRNGRLVRFQRTVQP